MRYQGQKVQIGLLFFLASKNHKTDAWFPVALGMGPAEQIRVVFLTEMHFMIHKLC